MDSARQTRRKCMTPDRGALLRASRTGFSRRAMSTNLSQVYDASAMSFRSGFAAIIGLPNVGKSTLVNRLVGQKVAIVSPKPQTTRNRIQGIINLPQAQIVLIDTPGMHRPDSALCRQIMEEVSQALEGIDVLVGMLDATDNIGPPAEYVFQRARNC